MPQIFDIIANEIASYKPNELEYSIEKCNRGDNIDDKHILSIEP